jgi:hypothetical protein
MPKENIFFQRISWHFIEVPKEILRAWKSYLLFNLNYFSIPLLLKTFFSPWRRYREPYARVFDAGKYLETFFANIIYCTLGAMMRSFLIIIGLFLEVFIFFAGLVIFWGWIILPFFLIKGLAIGLTMIFK